MTKERLPYHSNAKVAQSIKAIKSTIKNSK